MYQFYIHERNRKKCCLPTRIYEPLNTLHCWFIFKAYAKLSYNYHKRYMLIAVFEKTITVAIMDPLETQ